MFAVSVMTALINSTFDFNFAFYCISSILIFFAAYFFTVLFPNLLLSKNVVTNIFRLFVAVVLLQSVLALLMFIFPTFGSGLLELIVLPASEQNTFEKNQGLRLQGFGSYFFEAGIIHGMALIIIAYLFLSNNIRCFRLWTIIYIFIFIIGLLMARTTIIGLGLSMLLIFSWKPFNLNLIKLKIKWLFLFLLVLIIAVVMVLALMNEQVVKWAFEFFFSYAESGEFDSASTNRMQEMYIFPESFRTYIIGDGKYNLRNGYYMSTDVGYFRLLYYGGIPMLLSYYFYSWFLIRKIISLREDLLLRRFLYFSFFYILVLNFKGLADLNFLFLLIYICLYYQIKHQSTHSILHFK